MAKNKNGATDEEVAFSGIDVPIKHNGNAIILPATPVKMSYALGAATLIRKHEEDEQEVAVTEVTDAFPKDGAVAFQLAMMRTFGWVTAVPTPGFFGDKPPQTIDVEIGHNQRMSVIWSRFEIPGVEGYVECSATSTPKGPRFVLTGKVKRKHHNIIRNLAELTREIADKESIYRNKAIKIDVNEDGEVNWDEGIGFVDVSNVNPNELIFSESTHRQINTSLWTLIEKTDLCRAHKIPLKRGILLSGKYGTGKTLTSTVTALKAVANNWTFLTINRVSGLDEVLHFARKFQPCVIFAEDIDRIVSGDDRSVKIDDVLNTIDGIGSKSTEIVVVLTTNHIEKINRAMLRPGRLDAVIDVTPPDEAAVRKLIRLYGRKLVAADDTLDRSAKVLAGNIPAMIREAVERAKLYALSRADTEVVTDEDIHDAAVGMAEHMKLLETPAETPRALSLEEIVTNALKHSLGSVTDIVSTTNRTASQTARKVNDIGQIVAEAAMATGKQTDVTNALVELKTMVSRISR